MRTVTLNRDDFWSVERSAACDPWNDFVLSPLGLGGREIEEVEINVESIEYVDENNNWVKK